LDETAWVLLAANAAAAARLRQMQLSLTLALQARGWQGPVLKVKVRARSCCGLDGVPSTRSGPTSP
jgi:hypothetical protein